MSNNEMKLYINLQLFGEGGDGGNGAEAGVTSADAGQMATRSGVKNPLANVKYGVQDGVQATDAQSVSLDDRNSKFEELIKGEYKDLYDARVQDTIQKRLKSSKETIDKYNAMTPVMDMIARKYGVDGNDPDALMKALEEDDSYYEDEALEKGLSVQQLKDIKRMERENAELKRAVDDQKRRESVERIYADWIEQEKRAKEIYPSLDLRTELQNEEFAKLLQANVDVASAYMVVHKDEIIPAAMQYSAQTIEKRLANKVMSGRPSESAASSQSAALVKSDVSMLSKADRREIIRRVAAGEKIRFGN